MTKTKTKAKTGYRNHEAGSRKGRVHELFDKSGPDAAWTLGKKLKLKEGTLRSWFGAWRREDSSAKAKKAKPAKAKEAKKPTPPLSRLTSRPSSAEMRAA